MSYQNDKEFNRQLLVAMAMNPDLNQGKTFALSHIIGSIKLTLFSAILFSATMNGDVRVPTATIFEDM